MELKLFWESLVLISFVHLETTYSGLISTCILMVSVAIEVVTFNGLLIFIATIIYNFTIIAVVWFPLQLIPLQCNLHYLNTSVGSAPIASQ